LLVETGTPRQSIRDMGFSIQVGDFLTCARDDKVAGCVKNT
jgi:hypothetical protein